MPTSIQLPASSAADLLPQLEVAYQNALKLAAMGVPVFPVYPPAYEGECSCKEGKKCKSPCKHPMNGGGHTRGSADVAVIERWHHAAKNVLGTPCNWGVRAGETALGMLCVIDLDGEEGVSNWKKLLLDAGLSEIDPLNSGTLCVSTSKGGVHIYLIGELPQSASQIAPKVDTRGNGMGYVVSPGSIHLTGHVYEANQPVDDLTILPMDARLKSLLESKIGNKGVKKLKAGALSGKKKVSAPPKGEEAISEGGRNDALFRECCSMRANNVPMDQAFTSLWELNREVCDPPLDEEEVQAIVENVYSRYPAGVGTTQAGSPWKDHLMFTISKEHGRVQRRYRPFMENVLLTLNLAPEWKGTLRFNQDAKQVEVLREDGTWGRIDGTTGTRLKRFVERELTFSPRLSDCEGSIFEAAHANKASPLTDYLSNLTWDGVERLSSLLQKYLGVEDSELNREVFIRQMVASVARVMQPGCKHDVMLVLQGAQGLGKSGFIRSLYGDEHFSDSPSLKDPHNKDNLAGIVSKWVIEFPELSGMKRGEVEDIKKFITSREDTFRPPYGRHLETHPRTCVFWGSTNEAKPLMDSTGNRRFQIVTCTRAITRGDSEEIAAMRDQLWAEAVELYRAGKAWWFLDGEERLIQQSAEVAASFVEESPIEEKIVAYIDDIHATDYVRASDLLSVCNLQMHAKNYSMLKVTLAKLQMEQKSPILDGKRARVYAPCLHKDAPNLALLTMENKLAETHHEGPLEVNLTTLEQHGFHLCTRLHVAAMSKLLRDSGWRQDSSSEDYRWTLPANCTHLPHEPAGEQHHEEHRPRTYRNHLVHPGSWTARC